MNKKLLLVLSILIILCSATFAQNTKSKFVVSVSGELDVNSSDALADIVNHAVIKSKLYTVLPNDRQFRETLKNEWKKGNVSDDRIIALAKNAGADYLCFAKITSLLGSNQIAVQLVNLRSEPMEYSNMGVARGRLNDLDYFAQKIQEAVDDMLGIESKAKKAEPEKPAQELAQPVYTTQAQPATFDKPEPAIQGTIVPGGSLAQKLAWLQKSADSHETYIIEVNADESIAPYTFEFRGGIDITIVLRGVGGNRTIKLSSHGTMFTVKKDVTFVLDNNITLRGHNGNNGSMVVVNGGEFKMNVGSCITGNTYIIDRKWLSGAGVYVVEKGNFTMSGGTISGNKTQWGGGVHVYSGTFTMSGGTISGNTATEAGGGVYVNDGGATFVMSGGTIAGNSARRVGGGLQLWKATFNMRGGIITSNTAGDEGGGLWYTNNSSFTKTGGTISGYKSDQASGNVVKDESGSILARKGHAIYRSENQRKETTAGPGVNFSCNNNICTGGWDE